MPRALWAAMILAASTAGASPLGVVWTQKAKCPEIGRNELLANHDMFAWIEKGKLVRHARATGKALPSWHLKAARPDLVQLSDALLVVRDPKGFAIVDATTGKQLWRREGKIDYSEQAERIVGANVLTVRVGKGKHPTRELELDDGQTGKATWKVALAQSWPVRALIAGPSLVFAVQGLPYDKPIAITAFSLADGSVAWSATGASSSGLDFASAVGDELLVSNDDTIAWYDAKGHAAQLALKLASVEAVAADRIYVMNGGDSDVTAVDRATKKPLWTVQRGGVAFGAVLGATPTSVYIRDDDQVVELDAKTGKPVAKYGLAGNAMRGFEGAPMVLGCDHTQLTALDPSGADVPVETATISGRINCTNCSEGQKVWVKAGGVRVATDAKGKFSLTLTGRGSLDVVAWFVEDETSKFAGSYTPAATVTLTGKQKYDLGTLSVEQEEEGD